MESTLSPRDIQARIRRGESPDQVAESAGVPTEQIEGFAGPVLAERAYVAEQARATTIRRRHATGAGVLLGVAVDEHVAQGGQVPEDARWDAWRREDGRWTVTVLVPGALEAATFCFDAKSRYVLPDDADARLLVGDVALPDSADMAIADALRSGEREPERAQDEPVVEPEEVPVLDEGRERHAPVASLKEARDRRAMEQLSLTDAVEPEADEARHELAADDEDDQHLAVPDAVGPRKKRPERRRVPSWDEIMFGGKQD